MCLRRNKYQSVGRFSFISSCRRREIMSTRLIPLLLLLMYLHSSGTPPRLFHQLLTRKWVSFSQLRHLQDTWSAKWGGWERGRCNVALSGAFLNSSSCYQRLIYCSLVSWWFFTPRSQINLSFWGINLYNLQTESLLNYIFHLLGV